ncbi:hypothetical protein GGX14DRAFT_359949 [Mycena pura]|uniref:Uncharacterized protein n=1 Tax=Mycena pura TaxID=153505 RepID=A0AAD6VJT7_9AGAR|nr:hypothetical protein GGX14DRAFT_359949 [Mycena pura]
MTERRYRRALDEVERLVVQRLLEMTKLGASSVAYKLREKIGKALKTCATAIQRALKDYNSAAAQLSPPRQQLTWAQVADITTVGGFDLLRDTRSDIRKLEWANPEHREATLLYLGISGHNEEIKRLNFEIPRLLTFMIDDHADYVRAIRSHISPSVSGLPLAHELSTQWQLRTNINCCIVEQLVRTSRLSGFTGSLLPSEREGREVDYSICLPDWATDTLGLEIVDDFDEAEETQNMDDDLVDCVMDQLFI